MNIRRKQLGLAIAGLAVVGGCAPFFLNAVQHKGTIEPTMATTPVRAQYQNPTVTKASVAKHSREYQKYYDMFQNADTASVFRVDPADWLNPIKMEKKAKVAACFTPGTPTEIMGAFMDAMANQPEGAWPVYTGNGKDYFNGSRWPGTKGTPYTVTWSLVPDGLSISGGAGEPTAGSNLFSTLDAAFASQGGRTKWVSLFQNIFDRWTQLSGMAYSRITVGGNDWDDGASWTSSGAAGARGEIRIGAHFIDGASGSNILAYNYFPGAGEGGNMVIDSANSASWGSSTNNFRFLRDVLGHEHGHGMAQSHVCPTNGTKLMEPFINTGFDGPQQDDIRCAHDLYGDFYEKATTSGNNTAANASNLGTLAVPSTTTFGTTPTDPAGTLQPSNTTVMSLHSTGPDVDYYKVTVNSAASLAVTVTPVGTTYPNAAQNNDGSCQTSVNFNALTVANLDFEIRNTDGSTVLFTGNSSAAGVAETGSVGLPGTGTFYVRVFSSAVTQTQLYTLGVTTTAIGGNQAPVLGAIGNKSVNELANLSFTLSATDADAGQTKTYSMTGAPTGATLNSSTGAFSWTPTEAQGPGTFNVTFTVTDNGVPVLSDSEAIVITVNEVNAAPDATNVNNATINENALYNFNVGGTDSDVPTQTLSYSLVGAPAGALINSSSGVFAWTPTEAQGGNPNTPYSFNIRISDGVTFTDKPITLTVNEVNAAPQMTTATTTYTVNEGVLLNFTATSTDNDQPAQTRTYSLSGAPAGATINASTGVFSFTPTEAQGPGTYNFQVIVTDNGPGNLTASQNFTVNVNEVNANPSVSTPQATYNVNELATLNFTATGNDSDLPAQTLTYSLSGAPAGASINPTNGAFTWTPSEAQGPNSYTFSVVVTDNGAGTLSGSTSVTVNVAEVNANPVLNLPGVLFSATEGAFFTFTATATDSDIPVQTLTYSLSGAPAGASIDPSTGVLSWTPSSAQAGNGFTFDVIVTDNGAPAKSDTKSVTVNVGISVKTFSGTLVLQDYPGVVTPGTSIPIVFEIRNVGSLTVLQTVTANIDGSNNFSFPITGLPGGTYDVAAKPSHWLRQVNGSVAVSASGASGLSFSTVNGDVDGDNVVSIFDYIALSDAFDSVDGDVNWVAAADLDGDGVVSIFDYIILSDHFDVVGDD